jgi:hypothetical protein
MTVRQVPPRRLHLFGEPSARLGEWREAGRSVRDASFASFANLAAESAIGGVSLALPSISPRHTSIISNDERAATEH